MKEGNKKSDKRIHLFDISNISLKPHREISTFILVLSLIFSLEIFLFYILYRLSASFFYYLVLISFVFFLSSIGYVTLSVYNETIKKKIKKFLTSDRVLVAWEYEDNEWQKIKDDKWLKNRYHSIAMGIATFILFGLIALLTEIIQKYSDQNSQISMFEIFIFACSVSLAMASAIYLSYYYDWKQNISRLIAIGHKEIYYNGNFFKSDNQHLLCDAHLTETEPTQLVFEVLDPSKENREINDEISISIPDRLVPEIKKFLDDAANPY